MDPIADFLSQIKNAQARQKESFAMPHSRTKLALAKILVKAGYLESAEKRGRLSRQVVVVKLKYKNGEPVISGLKRVSKLSRRVYVRHARILPVKDGYGLAVISTSRGLMSNKEARKRKLGGEIICEVW